MTGSRPEQTPWIPLGVDTVRFYPVEGARIKLGLPENKLIFLYAGRFAAEKGLLDLIDAIGLVSARAPLDHVEFILIGQGSMRERMQERIRAQKLEKVITLKDWVDQHLLATWYSAADAFVLPAWNEPLGRVILESMACGTPIIAAAVEGPTDHVKDGLNGLLFPPKAPEILATVLEQAIANWESLERMGGQALRYVEDNLTWRIVMDRVVEEVYLPLRLT